MEKSSSASYPQEADALSDRAISTIIGGSKMVQPLNPTEENEKEYDLFVSHSGHDSEFVQRLVERIESEQYKGRNLRCFYAEWDILPGENIVLRLESGLAKSRYVGLVMSPDWAKSSWAMFERAVPVYEDPAGYKARTLPILRRPCEIPVSVKILKWYNFQNDRNFEREAKRLISRLKGESQRGAAEAGGRVPRYTEAVSDASRPDYQEEVLASNLFPVIRIPPFVFATRPTVLTRNEVFDELGEGVDLPPFAFHEDPLELYSFSDISNQANLLSRLAGETRRNDIAEVIRDNPSVAIELLNRSMTAHMRKLGMVYDWTNKKTFFPSIETGKIRRASWRVGARTFERTLVRPPRGTATYYAHRSCKATFTSFEQSLYLKVLPGWHFTTDGTGAAVDPQRMASYSTRWMNRERNHSVLDDLRFWMYTLSGGSASILLETGAGTPTEISSVPVFAMLDRGLEDDYRERLWFEEEPESEDGLEVQEEERGE